MPLMLVNEDEVGRQQNGSLCLFASQSAIFPLRARMSEQTGMVRVELLVDTHVSGGAETDVSRMCTNFSKIQPALPLVQGCEEIWLKNVDCRAASNLATARARIPLIWFVGIHALTICLDSRFSGRMAKRECETSSTLNAEISPQSTRGF